MQLHTKDPNNQKLLELLIQSGFSRTRIRESDDPTLVTQVSIKKNQVGVLVDLNRLVVKLSMGHHVHVVRVNDPMDVITVIASATHGAINIMVDHAGLERYPIGGGRHTVQTKYFHLN